jgi:hypothetical protein
VRAAHLSPPGDRQLFVGKAWWQLIAILLTFAVTLIGVMVLAFSCAVLRRTVFRFPAISAAALAMHLLQINQRP